MNTILITGGAGFVGSNLAIRFKRDYESVKVIALDNLKRKGSELNLERLRASGVEFIHGDIRNREDLNSLPKIDILVECSAEPSVLAGLNESPEYLLQTNLVGTLNCLELARKHSSQFIFLSTSRVYPIKTINSLQYEKGETRFELTNQSIPGASKLGCSESFPHEGVRSLYGATKLASELIFQEYIEYYNIKGVINRCGVLTGPWQMGKVDQGVIVYWISNHIFQKPLSYFGYGGTGNQVRDILHVEDLFDLIELQLKNINKCNGQIYNIGGGREVSLSLKELTSICFELSHNTIPIQSIPEDRISDIRIYLSDISKVSQHLGWKPKHSTREILSEIYKWIFENKEQLKPILG